MKRIALQLLLSFALIFQGAAAFGLTHAQHHCCCHGNQAMQGHCQHGHGTPCQPDCAQQCAGFAPCTWIGMPRFATAATALTMKLAPNSDASLHSHDDLPPTRPPIA